MIKGKKILAVVPARSGSKGLPGKNIRMLHGRPLLAWSIEQGLRSRYIDELLVSTDSEKIAEIARKYGASTPFLRPSDLAADDSPISDTIIHTLDRYNDMGKGYDYVALLEPTSPLRKADDLDNAIALFAENTWAETLVSVGEVHMEHPLIVKKLDSQGLVIPYMETSAKIFQRQQADKAYFPYGVIYIGKISIYTEKKTFYTQQTIPYFIERWQGYEIDDEIDFSIVEMIMSRQMEAING